MLNIDERVLAEEARQVCEDFLDREKRSLATYTGDSSLRYIPDENLERFKLSIADNVLYLPLESFLDESLDENQIMWHIYYELALYSDWKNHTNDYLNREKNYQKEMDRMTSYILGRVKSEKLEGDKAYQPQLIFNYVKKEVLEVFQTMDRYSGFLRVLQLCPIYREESHFKPIRAYMKDKNRSIKWLEGLPRHRAFINSFLIIELFDEIPIIESKILNPLDEIIFNKKVFEFVHDELVRQINAYQGILVRDKFILNFIYPIFERIWIEEIDEMIFYKSKEGEDSKRYQDKSNNDMEKAQKLEFSQEEIEELLKDMRDEKDKQSEVSKNILEGKIDLDSYGVSQIEQDLFIYYSDKMKAEREEMRKFWRKLIGEAQREVNVRKDEQTKGKLDIDSFIKYYPDFLESEKKGNYKNLPIFSRYLLEHEHNKLPSKVEISFVIDNSGSMTPTKIDAARKALAVTLLSIEDFNQYLKINSEKLNQKIEVFTETWFFGSKFYKVKKFKTNKDEERANIISSITKLSGGDGATDDASCLKEIRDNIDVFQESKLRKGREIKIIFEITDGASSFPGLTKEVLNDLLDKKVQVFAFQMGKNTDITKKTFNYIWNEGYKDPHGIIIGEKVEDLSKNLLKTVGRNMEDIFAG